MKRNLFFALIMAFIMPLSAQNYFQNFEQDLTGWAATEYWEITSDYADFGLFTSYPTIAFSYTQNVGENDTIYSPTFTFNGYADSNYTMTVNVGGYLGTASSMDYEYYVCVDDEWIGLGEYSMTSSGVETRKLSISAIWQYYSLSDEAHSFSFMFIHKGTSGTCVMWIDDFAMTQTGTHTVHFSMNDADDGTAMEPVTVTHSGNYTVPECSFTLTGAEFGYWVVMAGEYQDYAYPGSELQGIDCDVLLVPFFGYNIAFNANGGTGNMDTIFYVTSDEYTILPECTFQYSGKTFDYWCTSPSGTGDKAYPGDTVSFDASETVYAIWKNTQTGGETPTQGIDNINSASIALYPNPVLNTLVVSGVQASRIEVLDITGRIVTSVENANTIDMSACINGIYMVRISTDNGVAVRRIVKK